MVYTQDTVRINCPEKLEAVIVSVTDQLNNRLHIIANEEPTSFIDVMVKLGFEERQTDDITQG